MNAAPAQPVLEAELAELVHRHVLNARFFA
jgi:hypothetical protein